MTSEVLEKIHERMEYRLADFFKPIALLLRDHNCVCYYVAGSSCSTGPVNDFDLYPADEPWDFASLKNKANKMQLAIAHESKRTLTVIINGKPVQFCNYRQPSLIALIESFDFAHVQIGVTVRMDYDDDVYSWSRIQDVAYTIAYEHAMILDNTRYEGSAYPLSSLCRLPKYIQRGAYTNKIDWRKDVLKILSSIIERGFKDYDDFKDQLEAIDLGLLEECAEAKELYDICCRRGLVNRLGNLEVYGDFN